ncbi:S46 family peptidase [Roseivirga sp. BDSF3-8]|uniref:S46 family peptidase n=1 Tax=Roseivirga sp. BDSF3-8 TaxID=3241598 RepID=UPI003531D311
MNRLASKGLLLFLLIVLSFQSSHAVEGMWLPHLLSNLNEKEMQDLGMKLTAKDIYDINESSLKDAIVSFGGFCTGELISPEGLILTNHHCGYGQIQYHSSVENDLLTDGFWAMSREEELHNPGLFVSFIVRIEDVTDQVLEGVTPGMSEEDRATLIKDKTRAITGQATEGTHYEARIKPFYYGNEYYMFVTETYRDVRLVGAPPSSIGKFGGDTDNWMWPRHTGDFSLFRVYSGPDGKPAEYSEDNIPLKPRHFLPVNLGGVEPGDFTMVFGFPGTTEQYLTSHAVEQLTSEINPTRINIRQVKLDILDEAMANSDENRIKYASKYAGIANYWKKWIGENKGLERLNATRKKREEEEAFDEWANSGGRSGKYGNVITRFAEIYDGENELNMAYNTIREAILRLDIAALSRRLDQYASDESMSREDIEAYIDRFYKDYDVATEQKLTAAMLAKYRENVVGQFQPTTFTELLNEKDGDYEKLTAYLFNESVIDEKEELLAFLDKNKKKRVGKKLRKDPLFSLYRDFAYIYNEKIQPRKRTTDAELDELYRTYMAGLREMQEDRRFYPDANGTLRVAYGQVEGYEPADGVEYLHYTTLEGIMDKEDPDNAEFVVPAKLRELYLKKEYGPYGQDGMMPVCFTASNHTTGGNSGSPVIDAEGRLIGINFDRAWQGTMSDIMFDPEMCRNISVDARYILFIIDKFAGAGHLIKEMSLVNTGSPVPADSAE